MHTQNARHVSVRCYRDEILGIRTTGHKSCEQIPCDLAPTSSQTGIPTGQRPSGAWHQKLQMDMKMETTYRKANLVLFFLVQTSQEIQVKADS